LNEIVMTGEIKPIRNDADHAAALAAIEDLWQAAPGTPEHDRIEVLAMLVDDYESRRWPIDPADPVDLIRYVMEQRGLTRKRPRASAWLACAGLRSPEPPSPAHHEDGMAPARGLRHSGRRFDQAVRPGPLSGATPHRGRGGPLRAGRAWRLQFPSGRSQHEVRADSAFAP
jgi:hypothetical protein